MSTLVYGAVLLLVFAAGVYQIAKWIEDPLLRGFDRLFYKHVRPWLFKRLGIKDDSIQ